MTPRTGLLFLCVAAFGCRTTGKQTSDVLLAGGEEAVEGMFPATVMTPNCTATKVGPGHFLTAAHCVIDARGKKLDDKYASGSRIVFHHGVKAATAQPFTFTVKATLVHPSYRKAVMEQPVEEEFKAGNNLVDVALVVVKEESPEIPEAHLPGRHFPVGTPIVIGGYGCEHDFVKEQMEEHERELQRRRIDGAFGDGPSIVTAGEVDPENSWRRLKWALYEIYSYNEAKFLIHFESFPNEKPKGCPGDSGGAVYFNDVASGEDVKKHQFFNVIGVNSSIDPFTNSFARIDDDFAAVNQCLQAALQETRPASDDPLPAMCEE